MSWHVLHPKVIIKEFAPTREIVQDIVLTNLLHVVLDFIKFSEFVNVGVVYTRTSTAPMQIFQYLLRLSSVIVVV